MAFCGGRMEEGNPKWQWKALLPETFDVFEIFAIQVKVLSWKIAIKCV